MLPLLELVSDGKDHLMKDVTQGLADHFALTEDERRELLPSGQQKIINNRVAWAKAHMKMAGLLENPVRGYIRISPRGRDLLGTNPRRSISGHFVSIRRTWSSSTRRQRTGLRGE